METGNPFVSWIIRAPVLETILFFLFVFSVFFFFNTDNSPENGNLKVLIPQCQFAY